VGRWRVNPLLQTIRLWGFEPVVAWLSDDRPEILNHLRSRQCDTCVAVSRNRSLMERAASLANKLENRIRVAHALSTSFGEPWMEEELLTEAKTYMRSKIS
jgi:hypothetical protein